MKNLLRIALSCFFFGASMAYGGLPAVTVTVSDASGHAAFKGATNSGGTFATKNLKAGNYVVQFNSNDAAVKGRHYALIVSAGKKKVVADGVEGEKFLGGGAAMRLEVGSGLNITGQISPAGNFRIDPRTKKKMIWLPPRIGSNMPGRWVAADSPEAISAQNSGEVRAEDVRKWQDHADMPR
jgi:hypothetical protein